MHRPFLLETLRLAQLRKGSCAPNPSVGAVLEQNNSIISSGYHFGTGHPHAEVECLKAFDRVPADATLYLSLEPCCHWGQTPPCTELLKAKEVRRVVYGYRDPNPKVSGQGEKQLVDAGLSCEWVELSELNQFYQSYRYWTETKMPWVTIKMAMTLDGFGAGRTMERLKITGALCERFTHQKRKESDALLTSASTLIADDPQLNVRLEGITTYKKVYLIDRFAKAPVTARIFQTAESVTLFHTNEAAAESLSQLQNRGARPIQVPGLDEILKRIGEEGTHDLWVEVGPSLFREFVTGRKVQVCYLYISPTFLAGEGKKVLDSEVAKTLQSASIKNQLSLGADWVCEFRW